MRSENRDRARRLGALIALPLAALLALTACGSSNGAGQHESAAREVVDEDGSGGGSADRDGDDGAAAQDEAGGEDPSVSDDLEDISRLARTHLIRRAELTVLTDDVPGQYTKAVRVVESAGGYVSSESTQQDSEGYQHSSLALQVPPDRYEKTLADLSALGELHEREVSTEDVTDQVVDVDARIATQEESVVRVRELMEAAESLSDVVTLESELSSRQAELEALKARQASLREQTGMATITLMLREPEAEAEEESSDPSVGGALTGGLNALLTTLLWIVVVITAALPFAVVLLLLLLGWRALRPRLPERFRRARHGHRTEPVPPVPVAPPPTRSPETRAP